MTHHDERDPAAVARDPRREARSLVRLVGARGGARAILPLSRLVDADDQRAAALAFLRHGRDLLEP